MSWLISVPNERSAATVCLKTLCIWIPVREQFLYLNCPHFLCSFVLLCSFVVGTVAYLMGVSSKFSYSSL